MQTILNSGWQFLLVSGIFSHLLVGGLAIVFMIWALRKHSRKPNALRKVSMEKMQMQRESPHIEPLIQLFPLSYRILLGAILGSFFISFCSLNFLPYPATPLWVIVLLSWIVFPLAMFYGWFCYYALFVNEEGREKNWILGLLLPIGFVYGIANLVLDKQGSPKVQNLWDSIFPGLWVLILASLSFLLCKPFLKDSPFIREKEKVVKQLFNPSRASGGGQIEPYQAPLLPIIVGRWGMLFSYPEGWERLDPDNGDGYRFTYPENEEVYLIGSGSYTSLSNCENFCQAEVDQERSFIGEYTESEILLEGAIERWVLADSSQVNNAYNQALEGYQFYYSYTGNSGKKMFAMKSFTVYAGINFTIYAHCPLALRERFEPLFQEVATKYFVLERDEEANTLEGF